MGKMATKQNLNNAIVQQKAGQIKPAIPKYLIVKAIERIIARDMQNSIPLFLSIKPSFIEKITAKILANPNKCLTIGIAGESASGKTTFTHNAIKVCLGGSRQTLFNLINSDNYFKDTSKELIECGGFEGLFATGFSFDEPDALNLEQMKKDIQNLQKGESIQCPNYDFVTCVSNSNGETKHPSKLIITEGLFTLTNTLKDIFDIKIYVETPQEVIKERWYKRAESRGKFGNAADVQFNIVNQGANKHIRPTAKEADLVLNGLVSAEYIEFISCEIQKAIRAISV